MSEIFCVIVDESDVIYLLCSSAFCVIVVVVTANM